MFQPDALANANPINISFGLALARFVFGEHVADCPENLSPSLRLTARECAQSRLGHAKARAKEFPRLAECRAEREVRGAESNEQIEGLHPTLRTEQGICHNRQAAARDEVFELELRQRRDPAVAAGIKAKRDAVMNQDAARDGRRATLLALGVEGVPDKRSPLSISVVMPASSRHTLESLRGFRSVRFRACAFAPSNNAAELIGGGLPIW